MRSRQPDQSLEPFDHAVAARSARAIATAAFRRRATGPPPSRRCGRHPPTRRRSPLPPAPRLQPPRCRPIPESQSPAFRRPALRAQRSATPPTGTGTTHRIGAGKRRPGWPVGSRRTGFDQQRRTPARGLPARRGPVRPRKGIADRPRRRPRSTSISRSNPFWWVRRPAATNRLPGPGSRQGGQRAQARAVDRVRQHGDSLRGHAETRGHLLGPPPDADTAPGQRLGRAAYRRAA